MWRTRGNPETGRPESGWLEQAIAARPVRAAVICLVLAAALAAGFWLTGRPGFIPIGILFLLMSSWFFVYPLIRKGIISLERRSRGRTQRPVGPPEGNGPTREEIVARWQDRAQQEEMNKAIKKSKTRKVKI